MLYNKYTVTLVSALSLTAVAWASDVYIDQAGGTSTFNITQSTGNNRVGTSSENSTFSGDGITVDITQTGTLNAIDITATTAGGTTIDYTALGDSNTMEVDITGGTGNSLAVNIDGDSNHVTMCGTNDLSTAAAAGSGGVAGSVGAGARTVGCTAGVDVNDTSNTVTLTGSSNAVNLALGSTDATNTVVATGDSNAVNITQGGAGIHTVDVTIAGDTNTINIVQSTTP